MKYNNRTLIIAEVGVNHNGRLSLLKKTVNEISKLDVDFIKFQLFNTNKLVTPDSISADYAKKNFINQHKMLKKYQLKKKHLDYIESIRKDKKNKFRILFTPFDENSLNYLIKKKYNTIKISSSDITTIPFLEQISKHKIKIIMSSGMSKINDINNAIKTLTANKKIYKKDINLLYCVSSYPTELSEIDLKKIKELTNKYKHHNIGLSDHTKSKVTGAISVTFGATIIEKHVTINNSFIGPDHKSSLNINDFKEYVTNIRDAEKILNEKKKKNNQNKNIRYVRKYLVAIKKIKKDERFTRLNLGYMRCTKGVHESKYYKKFLNQISIKNYEKFEPIK